MGFSQQSGEVSIMWKDKTATTNGTSTYIIPQFQAENLLFDSQLKQMELLKSIEKKIVADSSKKDSPKN